ncbi:MAG: xanthine dehydrogenase accessory factor [Thermotogota bacterium]|nr:xanthine dehydrogenase accessory factor [Thermotogota bacterium]MDK2864231.1 xanthine dehydrogenase accessory factor [Thermotogota bacterium]HCZ07202.1 xanthine dehydrogenase [Thermotogota bacterium]
MIGDTRRVLKAVLESNRPLVLATVVDRKTSSERPLGAKIVVFDDGTVVGSLGGGKLEEAVVKRAKELVKTGESALFSYVEHRSQVANTDRTCGERTLVFLEYFGPRKRVLVFGAGTIGMNVLRILREINYTTVVIDEPPFCEHAKDLADEVICLEDWKNIPVEVDRYSFVVVLTRGHAHDLDVLRHVVRSEAPYIGMIGSPKKNAELKDAFLKEGFTEDDWNRIKTPIGLDINAQTPEEIALAIAAEVVSFWRKK